MEVSEKETIVLINQGDITAGYFVFDTCLPSHFARLCRRIGGKENLISVRIEKTKGEGTKWWSAKVPARYLSMATFGVKSAGKMGVSSFKKPRVAMFPESKISNPKLDT